MYYLQGVLTPQETILNILRKDGLELKYVKRPTRDMCITAITQNMKALQYVKDISSTIRKLVLGSLNLTEQDISTHSDKLLDTIDRFGLILLLVNNQTDDIVIRAIDSDINAIVGVNDFTEKVIEYIVLNKREAIKHIKFNCTKEVRFILKG